MIMDDRRRRSLAGRGFLKGCCRWTEWVLRMLGNGADGIGGGAEKED